MDGPTVSQAPLRVAVAGAGAFGKNHLRVYRELETAGLPVALVAAVEPDAARAAETVAKYAIPVFDTVDELLAADLHIDAATVAVPTVHHHAVASTLLDAGLDLLVEKPLAASLAEADDLIARAERDKRILQPGHLERFNPAVLAVQPQLRRPMFFESHRLSVFTPRALDVDVVLDLMIHDLDIVLTFAASPVREVRAVGLPILSPRVDIANVRVEFESGCVANFTASRVSTERVRKLRFFEPRQYVSIDYARQDLLVIKMDEDAAGSICRRRLPRPLRPAKPIRLCWPSWPPLEQPVPRRDCPSSSRRLRPASRCDWRFSLSWSQCERAANRCVTARQGRDALALALEIQASMAAHAQRAGLENFFNPGA